ncbi:MAG: DUF1016 family protein, partial [Victivallales bacterium]|nr:DUF1016 family protein [Victivallales bacterium]
MKEDVMPKDFTSAVKDIKLAILQARARAAQLSNIEALKLYFFVGGYISKKTRSAKWGTGAIDALSERLQVELPGLRGFSVTSIKKMRLFFDAWAPCLTIRPLPTDEISIIPIRPLPTDELTDEDFKAFCNCGFSHHVEIFSFTKNLDERLYYIHACAKNQWTVDTLRNHLRADDYHHIGALPNNFEKTLSPMALATQAVRSFRDEYLLDLVNLDNVDATKDEDIDERVLSKMLVADVEKTIQALGGDDFCFIGREKRLVYSNEEFFIDLLFFHRGLQALIAVELKMGKFRPSYLGQLEFYLSAL